MAEEFPCYLVFTTRDSAVEFSFKKDAEDELIIYSLPRHDLMLIGAYPGRYICAYRVQQTGTKGRFSIDIKKDQVREFVIPPYSSINFYH